MAEQVHYWTPDEVRALPDDGRRYECIDGALLVTPAPRWLHQRALRELAFKLQSYVERERIGELLWAPADIEIVRDTLVQPDLFVTGRVDVAGREPRWGDLRSLALAVEVLSPSTARYDRGIKRRFYQRAPVDEYWIVDIDARVVEQWRRGDDRPTVATSELNWQPVGTTTGFTLEVADYFRTVFGE